MLLKSIGVETPAVTPKLMLSSAFEFSVAICALALKMPIERANNKINFFIFSNLKH
jgi:hypothetical protein